MNRSFVTTSPPRMAGPRPVSAIHAKRLSILRCRSHLHRPQILRASNESHFRMLGSNLAGSHSWAWRAPGHRIAGPPSLLLARSELLLRTSLLQPAHERLLAGCV